MNIKKVVRVQNKWDSYVWRNYEANYICNVLLVGMY